MEHREIIAVLNYPDRDLVRYAVDRANLTDPEWDIICLREYQGDTIESAAERLLVSPRTIKRRYGEGMKKLDSCWSGLPWVNSIIKQ